ncbi:MAG: histidine phosphatase family protein [Clostridia bacterium]|nr:histidine phosphatase family protein [Clostridia bacterium]
MLFFFVRHGHPIYKPDSLTELGHEQAEALAPRFALHGLDRIYASSHNRTIQTAEPTARALGKEIIPLDWCMEELATKEFMHLRPGPDRMHHYWCFQLDDYVELFHSPEVRAMGQNWWKHPAFANETFHDGLERIRKESDAFFESLGYKHDVENARYIPIAPTEERIALFAHQGFGLAFLSVVMDIPYPIFSTEFDFGYTGVTAIHFKVYGDGMVYPKILQLSNDSHLYHAGMSTSYQNGLPI